MLDAMLPSRTAAAAPDAGRTVAVVGAGFSGAMAAIHLRHALPPDWTVTLFDRTGRFARGPAYAASDVPHLLNVRSVNMSAFPDDPGHFERWLTDRAAALPDELRASEAGTFATRRLYGRYLRALLYAEMKASGGRVRLSADEVVGLDREPDGWRLRCASGREVAAAGIVLAVGNLPSVRPGDGIVFRDPWCDAATAGLRGGEPVLVVGTGLTMVDLALGMRARGFDGPILALSRRGLVPQPHAPICPAVPAPAFTAGEQGSITRMMRRVRAHVRDAAARGVPWQAVIDGLRPVTSALWQGLPAKERGRFLRHLRPYWDVHRHRMAPPVAREVAGLLDSGALRLLRGRVHGIDVAGGSARVTVRDRDRKCEQVLEVQRVVIAIGAGAPASCDGLVHGLLRVGLAGTDRHGLGLQVTDRLALVGRNGDTVPGAWALGPIVRGVFWECTAVPDIRVQARTVAADVAARLAGRT